METSVTDNIESEELDTEQFTELEITAKVFHDKEQNKNDGLNRYAIVLGDEAVIIESKDQ